MAARKSWRQRVQSTRLAIDGIKEAYRARIAPLLPPEIDFLTATAKEIDDHRRRDRELEERGVTFLHRPCTCFPVLQIVPAGHEHWLDISASPVPTRRFRRGAAMSFADYEAPPKPRELSMPLVHCSPTFEIRASSDEATALPSPTRRAQLSLYGNPASLSELAKAADIMEEVLYCVPRNRRLEIGEGTLGISDQDWKTMGSVERMAFVLMDIGWNADLEEESCDLFMFHRKLFFEGQVEEIPCDCKGLSDEQVFHELNHQRHMDIMGLSLLGSGDIRPPLMPSGAWRITHSSVCDMFTLFDALARRWLADPQAPVDLISHRQAANIADVVPKTIRSWLDMGRLTGYGKGRQISKAEIEAKVPTLRLRSPPRKGKPRRPT